MYRQWICSTAILPYPDLRWLQEASSSDVFPIEVTLYNEELELLLISYCSDMIENGSLTDLMTAVFKRENCSPGLSTMWYLILLEVTIKIGL